MAEAANPAAPAPGTTLAVAAFLAAGLLVAGAALAYAHLAYLTTLECDRETDACVIAEAKPYWKDELDRFKASGLGEAVHRTRATPKGTP